MRFFVDTVKVKLRREEKIDVAIVAALEKIVDARTCKNFQMTGTQGAAILLLVMSRERAPWVQFV